MYCIKCGNQLQEGSAFCAKCGTAVQQTVPQGQPVRQTVSQGQPSVQQTVPQGQPVRQTVSQGQPSVQQTVPQGQSPVRQTVSQGQPSVQQTVTQRQPVRQTVPQGQPVRQTVSQGQPSVQQTVPQGQPPVQQTVPQGQPPVRQTVSQGHPVQPPYQQVRQQQPVRQQPPVRRSGKWQLWVSALASFMVVVLIGSAIMIAYGKARYNRYSPYIASDYDEYEEGNVVEIHVPQTEQYLSSALRCSDYMTKAYLNAMLLTEQLSRAAEEQVDPEVFSKLLDQTVVAWDLVDYTSQTVDHLADVLIEAEARPDYQPTIAMVIKDDGKGNIYSAVKENFSDSIDDLLFTKVYAADDEEFDAKAWARQIQFYYDCGDNGQKIKTLAKYMGLDADDKGQCKQAFEAFKTAQEILKGDYDADAKFYDICYKSAAVIKTASKVGLVYATCSAGGIVGVVAYGGLIVKGADALLSVAETGAMLVYGEDNTIALTAKDIQESTAWKTTAAVVGGAGIVKGWSAFSTLEVPRQELLMYNTGAYIQANVINTLAGGKINAMSKAYGELACAVYNSRAKGASEEEIRQALKAAGLDDATIEKALLNPPEPAEDESNLKTLEEIPDDTLENMVEQTDVTAEAEEAKADLNEIRKDTDFLASLENDTDVTEESTELSWVEPEDVEDDDLGEPEEDRGGYMMYNDDPDNSSDLSRFADTYYGTYSSSLDNETYSCELIISYEDGIPYPFANGGLSRYDSCTFDPNTLSGKAELQSYTNERLYCIFTWQFKEEDGKIKCTLKKEDYIDGDLYETNWFNVEK